MCLYNIGIVKAKNNNNSHVVSSDTNLIEHPINVLNCLFNISAWAVYVYLRESLLVCTSAYYTYPNLIMLVIGAYKIMV